VQNIGKPVLHAKALLSALREFPLILKLVCKDVTGAGASDHILPPILVKAALGPVLDCRPRHLISAETKTVIRLKLKL
jgi:hypothetical protein